MADGRQRDGTATREGRHRHGRVVGPRRGVLRRAGARRSGRRHLRAPRRPVGRDRGARGGARAAVRRRRGGRLASGGCERVVAEAMDALGQIDILVNNAGYEPVVPATREEPDAFRHVMDVNVCGSYWTAQACGRVMGPGSSIVNIGSILGMTTFAL